MGFIPYPYITVIHKKYKKAFIKNAEMQNGNFLNSFSLFLSTNVNIGEQIGVLVGIAIFVLEIILYNKYKKSNKKKENAIANGHVVRAKQVRRWNDRKDANDTNYYYHSVYEYVVSGKTYTYKCMSKTYPPLLITLYYKKNPKRAWSDLDDNRSVHAFFIIIIPIAVTVFIIYLSGGF